MKKGDTIEDENISSSSLGDVEIKEQYKNFIAMPFRVFTYVDCKGPYKYEFILKIRNDIISDAHALNVFVRIPLPRNTNSTLVDFGGDSSGNSGGNGAQKNNAAKSNSSSRGISDNENMSYEYKSEEKLVNWVIKKFIGNTELICRIRIALDSQLTANPKRHFGPISLRFEIPQHNSTGLSIKFLNIEEKNSNYSPARWIRYTTQTQSYIAKVA